MVAERGWKSGINNTPSSYSVLCDKRRSQRDLCAATNNAVKWQKFGPMSCEYHAEVQTIHCILEPYFSFDIIVMMILNEIKKEKIA